MITKTVKKQVLMRAARLVAKKKMGVEDALYEAAGLNYTGRGRPPFARYRETQALIRANPLPQRRKAEAMIRLARSL